MIRFVENAPLGEIEKELIIALYNEYHRVMAGVAYKILKDKLLTEEAVSESFIKIIRHRKKLTDVKCPQTRVYIVSIVRTTSYDIVNRQNKHIHEPYDELNETPDVTQNVLNNVTAEEGYLSIKEELKNLPQKLRDVAHRYFSHEMKYEEIAMELDITIDAAKKRLSRAREIIKKRLGGDSDA